MPGDVFISYSAADRKCAFEVVDRLEARSVGVWIAPRDLAPAAEWAEQIIEAISRARLMVLMFSSHSNASPQVRREVERAIHKQLPVLPFRLEDVLPSKSLEYFLSSQHWLDGFPGPPEAHYERLCAYVVARLSAAEAPAPAGPAPPADAGAAGAPILTAVSLSPEQLQSLERTLAHHIGPLAHYLVQQAAATAHDWEQLLSRLAAEIDSAPARAQFIRATRTLARPTL